MMRKTINYLTENLTITTAIVFTLVFTALTLPNLIHQNLVGDEAVYIVEGDRYLHQAYSYYHNSGSPVLLKVLTAIPFSLLPLDRTYDLYYNQIFTNVYKVAGFTYIQNKEFVTLIIILARLPHLLLAIALGITIFLFAKKYFSVTTGWVALTFYTFHASILAHAATANLDIGVTAFSFWSLCLFYLYLKSSDHSRFLLISSGVMLGLAQATKISAILLFPFIIAWFLISHGHKKLRDIIIIILISIGTLWAVYLFQVGPILTAEDTPAGIESVYGGLPVFKEYKSEITELLYKPVYPLGAYLNNFAYQLSHSFYGHTNYIDGEFTNTGIWYYIPLVFTIKNSIIFVLACILGLSLLYYTKNEHREMHYFLWSWILFVLAWTIQSKLQLGIRYSFPMYPFLFISAAAGTLHWINTLCKRKYVIPLIVVVLTLYAASTLRVRGDYFTYISEIYRGDNPVDMVFDSDYDWGQNIYKVAKFQQTKKLYPLFFRGYIGGNFEYEGIQNAMDPAEAMAKKMDGYYAFSHSAFVNTRLNNPELFSYFYSKRPTYIIGKNIYVYYTTFPGN
ncbi:MAG: glycosyltransferase family 39 protein [bacterium]|nr:glycosyltransferase family 39 protein [bacterium]